MANFRVETVFDPNTKLYFAELYYPSDAKRPLAATQPVYPSHEEAIQDSVNMMKSAFPTKPISKTT